MEGVLGDSDSFGRRGFEPCRRVKEKPFTGNSKETCAMDSTVK